MNRKSRSSVAIESLEERTLLDSVGVLDTGTSGTATVAKAAKTTTQTTAVLQSTYVPQLRPEMAEVREEGLREYVVASERTGADAYRNSTDGMVLGWAENYILEGFLSMYEATGDPAYLVRATEDIDRVLANRSDRIGLIDEVRGGPVAAWVTTFRPGYGTGPAYAYLVQNANIVAPIARWAYLVRRDLPGAKDLLAKASAYLRDVEATIKVFDGDWRTLGANEAYYVEPTENNRIVPFNQQNAMGRVYVAMYLATAKQLYWRRAVRLGLYFKNRLTEADGAYQWRYREGYSMCEDTGHGGLNIDFALELYRAGIVFDQADLEKFGRTFAKATVYRDDGSVAGWCAYINGTGTIAYNSAGLWGRLGQVVGQVAIDVARYINYHSVTSAARLAEASVVPRRDYYIGSKLLSLTAA